MYNPVGPMRRVSVSATARALNITEDPERIPVRCVPPAHYSTGGCPGVFLTETPRTENPWTETPPDRDPCILDRDPLDRDPLDRIPGQRPLGQGPTKTETPKTETETLPCEQTNTCENITFATFVCGR